MDANSVVLVHDPYDVFLAVGFGFCYGSALLPAIRKLERQQRRRGPSSSPASPQPSGSEEKQQQWIKGFIRWTVLFRGALTIIGLGCLYAWYSLYLKEFYPGEMPAYRHILDWFSLALFAIGANFWGNEDHHETLYCFVQGAATVAFGATCYLAFLQVATPDQRTTPLLKAMFWGAVVTSAYLFNVLLTYIFGKVYSNKNRDARKTGGIVFLIIVIVPAAFGFGMWHAFQVLGIGKYFPKLLPGFGIYVAAILIFVIVLVLALLVETKTIQSRVRSALITLLPSVVSQFFRNRLQPPLLRYCCWVNASADGR